MEGCSNDISKTELGKLSTQIQRSIRHGAKVCHDLGKSSGLPVDITGTPRGTGHRLHRHRINGHLLD